MPVEPVIAVLTAAILANLALMLAVLLAPSIRRRRAVALERREEEAEAKRSAARDVVRSGRELVVASPTEAGAPASQDATVGERGEVSDETHAETPAGSADRGPDDRDGPDQDEEDRPGGRGGTTLAQQAEEDETVADLDPDDGAAGDLVSDREADQRGLERRMLSRPDATGTDQPRRFPVVIHHDPHAGRTIEAFFSSLQAPADDGMDDVGDAELPLDDVALAPDGLRDPLTGLDGPRAWEGWLRVEEARLVRYRRPTTVVVGELDGLRRLTDRFGTEPARRLLPAVADAFRREARAADRVARLGWDRFAVLLPETDEIQAINYVERVRAACDRWLESGAVAMRLSLGWASPSGSGTLGSALRIAEQRMHAERRRGDPPSGFDPAATGTDGL